MFEQDCDSHAPIPGTVSAPRALFIHRYGTLLRTPERGWAATPDDVDFFPGALDALFRASRSGWKIYLFGNDDEVAYGEVPPAAWGQIQARIAHKLDHAGIQVQRSYVCTVRPDGVESQRGDSVYQLPNTGAFYHAAHTDDIDLGRSWLIGDSTQELVAGWRSGIRLAGVRTGLGVADRTFEVEPDLMVDGIAVAVEVLLGNAAQAA